MDRFAMPRSFVVSVLLLLATGCAHVVSTEVREGAREDLTFPVVHQDPEAYRGEMVIWGGVILETLNQPEGSVMTVLETPLDSWGLPHDAEYSRGRFMARAASFLDAEVYRKGRKVTLAGEIVGRDLRPLGQTQYAYPVLSVRELHIWKETWPPYYGYAYGPYYWGPPWYWDWRYYSPHWRHYRR